jgi:glycosyltransferase involved in cell wall biosynthesis
MNPTNTINSESQATVGQHRPGALILVGMRRLNKRTCLFFEGLLDAGYEPAVVCPPRGRWSWTRFEDPNMQLKGGRVFLNRPGAEPQLTNTSLVLCLHWAMLPMAVELASINNAPLIYDEHDFYELNTLEGDGSRLRRRFQRALVSWIHRICLPVVDQITCIHMAKGVLKHHLQRFNNSVLELHNYPTREWVAGTHRRQTPDGPICFVFVGGIYEVKGCRTVAQAYQQLKQQPGDQVPELHFFGDGDANLKQWLSQQPGVHVHSERSPDEVRRFLSQRTCVGLMLYEDGPRYRILGTNSRKMYEYLAAGAAIVASALGEIRAFLRNHEVGYSIRANASIDELAGLFQQIIDDPSGVSRRSENAVRLMSQRDMNWENEWNKLIDTGILQTHKAA